MRPLAAMLLILLLAGCKEEQPKIVETIPSVKVITVAAQSRGQLRQISGTIEAVQKTTLGFPVGGTIQDLLGEPGQAVTRGQVLARLDPQDYKIAASSANARLRSARADLAREKSNLRRQRTLYRKKIVAKVELEKAQASYAAAKALVETAKSDVQKTRFDIKKTALVAPFSGTIAEKKVERFQEVKPAEPIFVIQGDRGLQVKVLVPETMIRQVSIGQAVTVGFPSLKNEEVGGTVSEISSQADAGNAFPVTITLANTKADLRSGLTAQATFDLQYKKGKSAFLIPLSAISLSAGSGAKKRQPGDKNRKSTIFLFDEKTKTIRRTIVRAGGVRGNLLEVFEGLKAGDKVVIAGVAFLQDGMKANQWNPDL